MGGSQDATDIRPDEGPWQSLLRNGMILPPMLSPVPETPRLEAGGDQPPATSLGVRTLSGFGWSSLTVVIKALLTFLVLVMLSRLLTPNDFGLIGIVWILTELVTRFGQTGIGHVLVQRQDLTGHHIEIAGTLSVSLGVAVAVGIWLSAPYVGLFFGEPTIATLLQVLCVTFVIGGVGVVPEHLLRRNLRFKQLMVVDILSYAAGYGLTATALALQGFGAWALAWAEVVRVLIRAVIASLYCPPSFRLRLTVREATDLIFRGAGYSFLQVFDFIVRTGGFFVVGCWLGATSLGYYTRADKLASLPFQYLGGNLFEVAFPAMAQRQQRIDRLGTAYLHGVELLLLAVLPVTALTFGTAPRIVSVVLGGQWGETVSVLQILAISIPFQTTGILNIAVVRASGAVYRETWRHAAHAVLVVFGAWLGSRWGLTGVAVAIVSAQIVASLIMTQAALSLLCLPLRRLLRRCLPALWVSSWMALALWLKAGCIGVWGWPAGLMLLFEMLICGTAIVAATCYAPSFARLWSVPWVLASVPFEALGITGRYLRLGLERFPVPYAASSSASSSRETQTR